MIVKGKAAAIGLEKVRPILLDSDDIDANMKDGVRGIQLGKQSRAQGKKKVDLTHVPAKTARQVIEKRVTTTSAHCVNTFNLLQFYRQSLKR